MLLMVANWIYYHSPISLDLKTRELSISYMGQYKVTFRDETLPEGNCFVPVEKLQKLMEKGVVGAGLFTFEPNQTN